MDKVTICKNIIAALDRIDKERLYIREQAALFLTETEIQRHEPVKMLPNPLWDDSTNNLEEVFSGIQQPISASQKIDAFAIECYNVCVDAFKKHRPKATRVKLSEPDPTNPLYKRIKQIVKGKLPNGSKVTLKDFETVINSQFASGHQAWNDSLDKIINEKFASKLESASCNALPTNKDDLYKSNPKNAI